MSLKDAGGGHAAQRLAAKRPGTEAEAGRVARFDRTVCRDDLWRVYNTVQENLIRGGMHARSANGRLGRTRGIRAIREDVRINTQLW